MSSASPENRASDPRPASATESDAVGTAGRLLERVLEQTLAGTELTWSDPRIRSALAEVAVKQGAGGTVLTPAVVAELVGAVMSISFGDNAGDSAVRRRASDAVAGSLWEDPVWHERLSSLWAGLRGER